MTTNLTTITETIPHSFLHFEIDLLSDQARKTLLKLSLDKGLTVNSKMSYLVGSNRDVSASFSRLIVSLQIDRVRIIL